MVVDGMWMLVLVLCLIYMFKLVVLWVEFVVLWAKHERKHVWTLHE